jgi:hypothetical protein
MQILGSQHRPQALKTHAHTVALWKSGSRLFKAFDLAGSAW